MYNESEYHSSFLSAAVSSSAVSTSCMIISVYSHTMSCFSGTNQKPERRRPFETGLVRHWALSILEKNPEISVGAKVEFPTGKKLLHLVVNTGTSLCPTVDLELVQTTRNVNGTRDSV